VKHNEWRKVRKRILDLDDHVCRICFKDTSEGVLHVHHINYSRDNNEASNLVTLCITCHNAVHRERYMPGDEEHIGRDTPWRLYRDA